MSPTTYGEVLARNIKAARSRNDLSQQVVAARMRALGYEAWLHQTVGNVEKGKRRVTAEEIHGLAHVLETSIAALMTPTNDDKLVEFPSGGAIAVAAVRRSVEGQNDGSVRWEGDTPVFEPEPMLRQLVAEGLLSHSRVNQSTGEVTTQDPASGQWNPREEGSP